MRSFENKVVVVTGAGAGIGRALAMNLAGRGARLALSDVNPNAAAETAGLCAARGAEVRSYRLDVADRAAVVEHAEQVATDFGGINVAVNNAGVALVGQLTEVTWEQLDWINGININGVLNGSKTFLPYLIASGDGHLVNMSSLWGLVGVALESHYCASKFFVRGLTESLRQEMRYAGHRVGVTAVHPGFVKTDLLRSGKHSDARAHGNSVEYVNRSVRLTPERVAERIVGGIEHNRARVLVGPDSYAGDLLARMLGSRYQGLLLQVAKKLG